MPSSAELVANDSSWRQRSELEAMADLSPELEQEVEKLDGEFWVSGKKLKEIVERFQKELDQGALMAAMSGSSATLTVFAGLHKNGKSIPMNLTWVHGMPSGKEKGTFLTLDLGGTNLRVCKVTLHGDEADPETPKTKSTLAQEQYKLPGQIKTSNADELWTYVADKVKTFLQDKGLDKTYTRQRPMPLGFTFSYPATQERIDHAILQTWTKGFDIKGVEGEDVAAQLRHKLEERDLPLELVCVINDTVGAMIASAYNDPATIVGAIFGTGCNAAYMSSLSSIAKLDKNDERLQASGKNSKSTQMAINCEYGAFDNSHRVLPRTRYDEQIDKESPRPGEQTFEKLSAGLYLGEIFRLILVDLADRDLIFANQDTSTLREPYTIDTGFLSQIEDDESQGFTTSREMFKSTLNLSSVSDQEIEFSRRVAELIAVRGARLCACGVAAICGMEGIREGHVAADGSVANKHPKFKKRWATALGEILGWGGEAKGGADGETRGAADEDPIMITSAEDGSGIGCAIIAAMELERRGKEA
jgi:hexokinase